VQEAERLGFDSLWATERVFHRINILDSLTVLSWAAALTQRIRLGTAALLLALHSPALVARAIASLDYLSGGRMNVCVTLGGHEAEHQGVGAAVKQQVARLRENVAMLRRLLSEETVTMGGRFQTLQEASVNPKPLRPAGMPILFGGFGDASLRRAGELADGWIGGGSSKLGDFVHQRQTIQEAAAARGRDLSAFTWGKLIYVAVADSRPQGRAMLQPYIHAYYSPQYDIDGACVFGTPDECVERLVPFVEAGLQLFIMGTPPTLDLEHLRRIARDVVPRLTAHA
jgi:alkanesulfonate monooxygenase SsuD/methylene tetrahydromethanopterin reductase-like flavin-dependent oxidoreductase (luciferase family)